MISGIGRGRLVPQVTSRLRELVLLLARQGVVELPSEGSLAERFEVSRTVLREAMKHLEAQGLVLMSQGKRPQIRPPDAQTAVDSLDLLVQRSKASLVHLAEVRRPLESEIAALAAVRADEAAVAAAEKAIEDLVAAETLDGQIDADVRFHRELARATGNPVYELLLETLDGLLRASRKATLGLHGRQIAVDHHRDILDAVRRRDPAAARARMQGHLGLNEEHLKGMST